MHKRETPCRHVFHLECIRHWLDAQGKNSCPNCRRKPITVRDLIAPNNAENEILEECSIHQLKKYVKEKVREQEDNIRSQFALEPIKVLKQNAKDHFEVSKAFFERSKRHKETSAEASALRSDARKEILDAYNAADKKKRSIYARNEALSELSGIHEAIADFIAKSRDVYFENRKDRLEELWDALDFTRDRFAEIGDEWQDLCDAVCYEIDNITENLFEAIDDSENAPALRRQFEAVMENIRERMSQRRRIDIETLENIRLNYVQMVQNVRAQFNTKANANLDQLSATFQEFSSSAQNIKSKFYAEMLEE